MNSEIDHDPIFRRLKMLPQAQGSSRQELMRVRLRAAFVEQNSKESRPLYSRGRITTLLIVALFLVALALAFRL